MCTVSSCVLQVRVIMCATGPPTTARFASAGVSRSHTRSHVVRQDPTTALFAASYLPRAAAEFPLRLLFRYLLFRDEATPLPRVLHANTPSMRLVVLNRTRHFSHANQCAKPRRFHSDPIPPHSDPTPFGPCPH